MLLRRLPVHRKIGKGTTQLGANFLESPGTKEKKVVLI